MMQSVLQKAWRIIRFIFGWMYKACRMTAITLGTLLMLAGVLSILDYFIDSPAHTELTEHIQLPNGFRLAPSYNFDGKTQILDQDGNQVVPPVVDDVMWCGDMIYGTRNDLSSSHPALYPGDHAEPFFYVHSQFIYDRKTKKLATYEDYLTYSIDLQPVVRTISDGTKEFDEELEKRNLPAFDYRKAVDYLSALNGTDIIPKGELCRTSCSHNNCGIE